GRAVFEDRIGGEVTDVAARDLVVAESQDAQRLTIGAQDRTVTGNVDDAPRKGLDQTLVELLAGAQRRLGCPALRNVLLQALVDPRQLLRARLGSLLQF